MCPSGIEEQLIIQPGARFPRSLPIPPQAIQKTNNNNNASRQWSTFGCDGSVCWVKESKQKTEGDISENAKKGRGYNSSHKTNQNDKQIQANYIE